MAKLNQEAKDYEPKQIKTIADLNEVSVDLDVQQEAEAEFPYKYVEVEGERYKVPYSVLAALKEILADNPTLKRFKVKKSGEGMKTKYTVIPLSNGKLLPGEEPIEDY